MHIDLVYKKYPLSEKTLYFCHVNMIFFILYEAYA
jgi:hypothetical protein